MTMPTTRRWALPDEDPDGFLAEWDADISATDRRWIAEDAALDLAIEAAEERRTDR